MILLTKRLKYIGRKCHNLIVRIENGIQEAAFMAAVTDLVDDRHQLDQSSFSISCDIKCLHMNSAIKNIVAAKKFWRNQDYFVSR